MADETILANPLHKTKIAYMGELDKIRDFEKILLANGSDLKAGYLATKSSETSDDDVDLYAAGEVPLIVEDYANIAEYKQDYSLGDTIPDNKQLKLLDPRLSQGRIGCQLVLSRSTTTALATLEAGIALFGTTDGKLTSTDSGDSAARKSYVGTLAERVDSGTADKVVGVWA